MRFSKNIYIILLLFSFTSCRYYTGHIMFETEDSIISDSLALVSVEQNYLIRKGDIFQFSVYGNNGEMIIDPDNLLKKELDLLTNQSRQTPIQYFVLNDGTVNLPVIGIHNLEGRTLFEATQYLNSKYSEFYNNSYVDIKILNKRIVVFGPSGGQVIPLENENMNLLEALALSKTMTEKVYADNIRLIRGNLSNPNVLLIDLSTIEGMKRANLALKPDDIIYIEPKRVLAGQALRENILPYVSVLTAVSQAVLLYLTLKQ